MQLTDEERRLAKTRMHELKNSISNSETKDINHYRFNDDKTRGMTLLHYACILGDKEAASEFLKQGADPNLCGVYQGEAIGPHPLVFAALYGHQQLVDLLIINGAKLKSELYSKQNPAWFNTMLKDAVKKEVLLALDEPVDNGLQLLSLYEKNLFLDDPELFQSISDKHKSLLSSIQFFYGDNLLSKAAEFGALKCIKKMITDGFSSLDKISTLTVHPADAAMQNEHWDCVQYFLTLGYDPNTINRGRRNYMGKSLLHLAVSNGNLDAILGMLDTSINPGIQDNLGNNFLHELFQSQCTEEDIKNILSRKKYLVEDLLLEENHFGITALSLAVEKNHIDLLMECGINVDSESLKKNAASRQDVSQGKLMDIIKLYLLLDVAKHPYPYSKSGYCLGYSILLLLLGHEKFYNILKEMDQWNRKPESLNQNIEDEALLSLGFKTKGELIEKFLYCLNWAQHPWIMFTCEIDLNKILAKFGVDYAFLGECEINTSNEVDTKDFLKLIFDLPPNTKVLLLGDGHACSILVNENREITYSDPSVMHGFLPFKNPTVLYDILKNIKFSLGQIGSTTSFAIFRSGSRVHNESDKAVINNIAAFKAKHKIPVQPVIGFFDKQATTFVYKDEKIYENDSSLLDIFMEKNTKPRLGGSGF